MVTDDGNTMHLDSEIRDVWLRSHRGRGELAASRPNHPIASDVLVNIVRRPIERRFIFFYLRCDCFFGRSIRSLIWQIFAQGFGSHPHGNAGRE